MSERETDIFLLFSEVSIGLRHPYKCATMTKDLRIKKERGQKGKIMAKYNFDSLKQYQLLQTERIEEMNADAYLLQHKASKARIALISNDDQNKVFNIGFRTPITNSTGVPHIMEHCVLCGSKNYPLKDPFIELVKGSLNTFLNAMTYPEKTLFPVASCNQKDFQNLMNVYIDAVFYPNIYKYQEIFKQEGWHYQLENEEEDISINGVVYNEMKGAFSCADDVLERQILAALFPDTSYAYESGGDPDVIPNLSYEEFLEFHRTYYHPANSYIYLYGDMDMMEKLTWLDEKYLKNFTGEKVESEIKEQKPFTQPIEVKTEYAITEDENEENHTYLSYNIVVNGYDDNHLNYAFQVLEYALFNMPGAPVKKALIDRGIGEDVYGDFNNGVRQPYFSIVAKNANESQKEEFLAVVKEELQKAVKKGLNKKSLLAGINQIEFRTREADFDYPKGLLYGIEMFNTWLFDDNRPFTPLKTNETFTFLKEQVEKGYFENLIQKLLLDNPHAAFVLAVPKKGLNAKKEQELAEKLKAYKESLSKEERKQLILDTKALEAYQEKEESKEDLEKIPLLDIKDISTKPEPFHNIEKNIDGVKVLHHNFFTNQIGYLILGFNTNALPERLLPYLGLYKTIFAMMNTEHYTYQELANECTLQMGGINLSTNVYGNYKNEDQFKLMTEIRIKVVYDKISYPFELAEEIIFHSKLDDKKRLKELITQTKSRLSSALMYRGNSTAALRAMSYHSKPAYINEYLRGIAFYEFISELNEHFEEKYSEIVQSLEELVTRIFRKENQIISYSADEKGFEQMTKYIPKWNKALCKKEITQERSLEETVQPKKKNEGFKCSSKVQYVAYAGNFLERGYDYTGVLKVFRMIMSYDYLWNQIRVKGGAYGCGNVCSRNGNCYFTSYRDPNLASTIETYKKVPEYLENFEADERDMKKYIIGTISEMDTPLTNSVRGSRSYSAYLSEIPYDALVKERQEVLHTTAQEIRALAPLVQSALKDENICVIGNDQKIEENKEIFNEIKNLI